MEQGFTDISEYETHRPSYGSYDIDFDPLQFLSEAHATYENKNAKVSGRNDFNRFNNVSKETKKYLVDYWNKKFDLDYDWNWEYFHSGEPAGLHTDYLCFPNSWKPNKDQITHDCYIVLGIIIPLEWTCKQPYTINYDKVSQIPRKLKYKKKEMRYQDNDEIYEYRKDYLYDDEVLKYNPKGVYINGK